MTCISKAISIETGDWLYGYFVGRDGMEYDYFNLDGDEIYITSGCNHIIPIPRLNKTIPVFWGVDVNTLCPYEEEVKD